MDLGYWGGIGGYSPGNCKLNDMEGPHENSPKVKIHLKQSGLIIVRLANFLDFHGFLIKSIFNYINGPHTKFIQIDMVLTFIFRQGLPGICIWKRSGNRSNDGKPSLDWFLDLL